VAQQIDEKRRKLRDSIARSSQPVVIPGCSHRVETHDNISAHCGRRTATVSEQIIPDRLSTSVASMLVS